MQAYQSAFGPFGSHRTTSNNTSQDASPSKRTRHAAFSDSEGTFYEDTTENSDFPRLGLRERRRQRLGEKSIDKSTSNGAVAQHNHSSEEELTPQGGMMTDIASPQCSGPCENNVQAPAPAEAEPLIADSPYGCGIRTTDPGQIYIVDPSRLSMALPSDSVPNALEIFGDYMKGTNKPSDGWVQACRICASWTGCTMQLGRFTVPMCPRCHRNWRTGDARMGCALLNAEVQGRLRAVLRELTKHDSVNTAALNLIAAIERAIFNQSDPAIALIKLDEAWAAFLGP